MAEHVAYGLWMAFVASWYAAALWAGRTKSRAPLWTRVTYAAGFSVGFGLLFTPVSGHPVLGPLHMGFQDLVPAGWAVPLWSSPPLLGWAAVAVEAAGFALAWWGRIHLGKLWSGLSTVREDHRVVASGPYRLSRHPIYAGVVASAWALAATAGAPGAVAGALVLTLVVWLKAREEESFLRRELGRAAYDGYAARTPMWAPFTRA